MFSRSIRAPSFHTQLTLHFARLAKEDDDWRNKDSETKNADDKRRPPKRYKRDWLTTFNARTTDERANAIRAAFNTAGLPHDVLLTIVEFEWGDLNDHERIVARAFRFFLTPAQELCCAMDQLKDRHDTAYSPRPGKLLKMRFVGGDGFVHHDRRFNGSQDATEKANMCQRAQRDRWFFCCDGTIVACTHDERPMGDTGVCTNGIVSDEEFPNGAQAYDVLEDIAHTANKNNGALSIKRLIEMTRNRSMFWLALKTNAQCGLVDWRSWDQAQQDPLDEEWWMISEDGALWDVL